MAAIAAHHLVRTLPGEVPTPLVRDISVQVNAGEFVCIMGPSGSGKSSLLYLLGLLDRPDAGRIFIGETEATGLDDEATTRLRLEKLGFVFQFHFLLPEFTLTENVSLPMRKRGLLSKAQAAERAHYLLDTLGLADHGHKLPHQISGGQRQRVAVARALANDPPLLLADEPTGNLDTASSANVRQILHDLTRQDGRTVIAVTHDPQFATAADRVITLVDGRLVQAGD